MEPWQNGYSLTFLKNLKTCCNTYNKQINSPSDKLSMERIAHALHEYEFASADGGIIINHTLETQDQLELDSGQIFIQDKDDIVISHLVVYDGYEDFMINLLNSYAWCTMPLWVYTIDSNQTQQHVMERSGFYKLGTKTNAFSDKFAVYHRDKLPNHILEKLKVKSMKSYVG